MPVGLILCIIAWSETRSGERGGHAFTVAGLTLSVIWFALMALAIALAASGVSLLSLVLDALLTG
ncbi:hypothetical protein [Actinotalea sp. JY-7885]|uniref:hypothetical protein n=1 Tax=Actinotalea sp. JY-7885 TaxID=2758576 RepID=UPI00165E7C68|nr:hypothetical protein [Actinotalea sp. JY-7885]